MGLSLSTTRVSRTANHLIIRSRTFASASSRVANRRALPHHLPDESAITSGFQLISVLVIGAGTLQRLDPRQLLLTGVGGLAVLSAAAAPSPAMTSAIVRCVLKAQLVPAGTSRAAIASAFRLAVPCAGKPIMVPLRL